MRASLIIFSILSKQLVSELASTISSGKVAEDQFRLFRASLSAISGIIDLSDNDLQQLRSEIAESIC